MSAPVEPCVWHPTSATPENAVVAATAINSLDNFNCLTPVFIVLKWLEQAAVQALDMQGIRYRARQKYGPPQMRRGEVNTGGYASTHNV
jgi:hypothetical protein